MHLHSVDARILNFTMDPNRSPSLRRRTLLLVLVLPALLGVAMALLVSLRGASWKAQAVEAVNTRLQGDLDVADITLSWWNGFPDVSVDLGQITLTNAAQDTLIRAERIGLELDVWSLLGASPVIHAVTVEGGRLLLAQDANGKWNLEELLVASEEPADKEVSLSVVKLHDVAVSLNLDHDVRAAMHVRRTEVEVDPSTSSFSWTLDLTEVRTEAIPELQPVALSGSGTVNPTETGAWAMVGELETAGMELDLALTVLDERDWQARIQAPHVTQHGLERLLTTPPWQGQIELDHEVALDANLSPNRIQASWSTAVEAFQIAPSLTGLTMAVQGVCGGAGEVVYERGAWRWAVKQAEARGTGWSFEGRIQPESAQRRQIAGTLELDASTPWEAWVPHLSQSLTSVLPVSGTATAKGSVIWDVARNTFSPLGTLALSQITGKLDGQPYMVEARELRFDAKHVATDSLHISWAGNVGDLSVRALSWPALIDEGPLKGKVAVDAQSIDVASVLTWWGHLDRSPSDEALLLPAGSELNLAIQSDVLEWDALQCRNLDATTKIQHTRWTIQSARVEGLEGHAHVEGALAPGRAGWQLTLRGTADDLSMPKLFATYNNFGQSLLRHDHLGGAVSTAGHLAMSWGLDGSWHAEDLTASLQTTLNHARLTGLEVFEEVADYLEGHRLMAPLVDPDDLRNRLQDVAFEPVSQRIDVRGEEVWLPMTVIESSAMNVAIEGAYDFDSNIDYTLGFALRDLRAGASDAFGEMEDDGLGNQFFLRMFGQVEAPEYEYDRDAAKARRRQAIQAEKARLKEALKTRRGDKEDAAGASSAKEETSTTPASPTTSSDEESKAKPPLLNRRNKGKGKDANNLFNPDDEDYL